MELDRILSWPLTPEKLRRLKAVIASMRIRGGKGVRTQSGASGQIVSVLKNREKIIDPLPYAVDLIETVIDEDAAYSVTVSEGYVSEVLPSINQANLQHKAEHRDGDDELIEYAIEIDQAVFIRVAVTANGEIGVSGDDDPVTIIVDSDDAESVHYQPKVDDETQTGAAGFMLYKLARCVADGGTVKLENVLAGSHIYYHQDLPKFRNTSNNRTGSGLILKRWRDSAEDYYLRVLTEGNGQATITTRDNDIEVRGTKKDANVKIWEGDDEPTTADIEFRDGYSITGTEVEGNEAVQPDPQQIDIKIPTVVAAEGSPITVNQIGVAGKVYEVDINDEYLPSGIWGTFTWTFEYTTSTMTITNEISLTFENGLLKSASGSSSAGTGTEIDPFEMLFSANAT